MISASDQIKSPQRANAGGLNKTKNENGISIKLLETFSKAYSTGVSNIRAKVYFGQKAYAAVRSYDCNFRSYLTVDFFHVDRTNPRARMGLIELDELLDEIRQKHPSTFGFGDRRITLHRPNGRTRSTGWVCPWTFENWRFSR